MSPPLSFTSDTSRASLRFPFGRASLLPLCLLAGLAALIWCWHHDRWTVASWQLPTVYSGDAHETLARLQAAMEGDIRPLQSQVITRLGAPFGAYWNAYPTPDKLLMLALGGLARLVGVFAAANAGLLLAQVTAALAFCLVARWLRCRWEWAMAGALLFAFTYSTFHRGLAHFSLVFTWTVPLGLLAVWLVARSRRLEWRRPGALVCLGAAVALGAHNPYNLYFWLQLLGWALVAQWFGPRRRPNLQIGLAALVLALVVFLAMHLEVWVHDHEPEGAPLLVRNYGGTEQYALKPVEMFIPPGVHRWAPLAFLGQRYTRWSDWRGETFLPYLGLVGILGLVWLGAVIARRLFADRPLPGQALSLGWLLAFASVGGITNLVAFFAGLQVFRATNRVGIFVSAIVLFFLVVRLSRLTAGWPRWVRVGAAVLVAGAGILDQVPRGPGVAESAEIATTVESDRMLGRKLEAVLPEGAMVFQLPVLGFPEVVPPWRLTDYEHFRLYFSTRTLRLSYGAAKLRARSRWQRELENVSPTVLVRRLEAYGFAALYLNRKGYEDRADSILRELAALGYTRRLEGRLGNQVIVFLRPAAVPQLPFARSPTFGQGWYQLPDNGVRWAYDDAVMSYFNPRAEPVSVDLRLALRAVGPRNLTLWHEGREIASLAVAQDERGLQVPGLILMPGVNRFTLRSDAPPSRADSGRYQLRSFGLRAATVRAPAITGAPE
ncbi:MAG: hypothetical protein PSV13_09840 [Lacunisphaera sp.]|nr:hypothetical protein [Lacunisphaera sp.]